MSKELIIEKIIREMLGDEDNVSPYIKRKLFAEYEKIASKLITVNKPAIHSEGYLEEITKEAWKVYNSYIDNFHRLPEIKDELYKKSYEGFKAELETYEVGPGDTDYSDLFTEVPEEGEPYLSEIFVRVIEEREKIKITSAKQLQEITRITEIYGYWEKEGTKKPTKKQAIATAWRQVEDTFIQAMHYRYTHTLETILEAGGSYSDLLLVEPSDFNLPETWDSLCLGKDKRSTILWELFMFYELDDNRGLWEAPSLRKIAEDLQAPYSVIMDAYHIARK